MKKKIIAALALLLALVFCISCGGNGNTESTEDTEAGTERPPVNAVDVVIAENGTTYYTMIRPENAPDPVIDCYRMINNTVEKNLGYTLAGNTDWVRSGTDTFGNTELLIGNSDRPEMRELMGQIGFDDYAVAMLDNKIMIAAHSEARLLEAADYFCTNMLSFRDGKVLFSGSYIFRGKTGEYIFAAPNRLEDYRIVIPAGNTKAAKSAETLQQNLRKAYGVVLPIVDDKTSGNEHEFVLGNTSRAISQRHLPSLDQTKFLVCTDEDQFLITGRDDASTQVAVERFCQRFVNKYYSNTLTMERGFEMTDIVYTFSESAELAAGSDIRIMSFNLLCELWDAKVPVEGRDVLVTAAIKYFAPDVIGIQEVSDNWHKSLNKLLRPEYVITDPKTSRGETNFSTLAYNVNKVKLVAHGSQVFSRGNNSKLRLATWGLFETIATGKKFIVMSTHWDLGSNPTYQQIHSDEMAALAIELQNRYEVPVVTTGDYNVNETSQYYKNFLDLTGFKDAKYTAEVINRACVTGHSLGSTPNTQPGNAIDHIFANDGFSFKYYNVIVDKTTVDASDHCPIYADLKFN